VLSSFAGRTSSLEDFCEDPDVNTLPAEPDENGALDPLIEEALAWLVKLHSGEAGDPDWDEYHRWCEIDAAHARASQAAEHLWESLGSPLARRKPSATLKVIALLSMLAVGAGVFSGGLMDMRDQLLADVKTGPLEQRSLTLADGSQIELDGGTSLDIRFDKGQRRLVLYSGDIYVKVVADQARPFRVEAGRTSVRALGTAFDVRRDGDDVEVAVSEHRVRVEVAGREPAQSVEVGEGFDVISEAGTGLGTVRKADLDRTTAWRRGRLVFVNRPLADVVAQMNRYRRGRVFVLDPALRRLPVTGTFEMTDGDALLDAVMATLPVRLRRLSWLTFVERDPMRPMEQFQSAPVP